MASTSKKSVVTREPRALRLGAAEIHALPLNAEAGKRVIVIAVVKIILGESENCGKSPEIALA